jgi:hypothetical protein
MSTVGTARDDGLAALKSKIRDAKLRAKGGDAPISPPELRKLKDAIEQEKLKRKRESLAREGGEGVEPLPVRELRKQVGVLRKKVKALSDSIGARKEGGVSTLEDTAGRKVRMEELKHSIRLEKVQAKQAGVEPSWGRIDRFKNEIRLWDLWNNFDLLDEKWIRWGGGDIDPVPYRTISYEVARLERKVDELGRGLA